jgi:hypothetical protein
MQMFANFVCDGTLVNDLETLVDNLKAPAEWQTSSFRSNRIDTSILGPASLRHSQANSVLARVSWSLSKCSCMKDFKGPCQRFAL